MTVKRKVALKLLEEGELVSCIILARVGRRRGYGNVETVNYPSQETHNTGLGTMRKYQEISFRDFSRLRDLLNLRDILTFRESGISSYSEI